jgi:hypothetical protein
MDELVDLSDEEVLASARHWRAQALRGVLHARGFAHDYELEVRRRWPKPVPSKATFVPQSASRRSLRRFWLP